MSPFTDKEIEYLRGQRLGRMATTGSHGAPHIVPVGFRLDPGAETIQIGGRGMSKSKKWRDLQVNPKIAFVVDDLASIDPWTPRGIVIRGSAELHHEAVNSASAAAGTQPGSRLCHSGLLAGASRGRPSPRPGGAAPGQSQRNDRGSRQPGTY